MDYACAETITMCNECIYLVEYVDSDEKDEFGDKKQTEIRKERFAELKSIGQTEFYQAQTAGMKPELKFELADYSDYSGEKELIYEGIRYKVMRTYKTKINSIEITCYGGVRDAGT